MHPTIHAMNYLVRLFERYQKYWHSAYMLNEPLELVWTPVGIQIVPKKALLGIPLGTSMMLLKRRRFDYTYKEWTKLALALLELTKQKNLQARALANELEAMKYPPVRVIEVKHEGNLAARL